MLKGTGLQSRTGHRHVAERCAEPKRGLPLTPKISAARVAVSMVGNERRGLGANDAFLDAGQQLPGLGERQAEPLQLVVGLVERQDLLVARSAVARLELQPDRDLHGSSPHQFSTIRREESLNHACDARTWISAP